MAEIQHDIQGRPFVHDHRGREMKARADNRVRGTYRCGAEAHGFVANIYPTEKYGPVLLIVDRDNCEHNLPASACRRMYGETKALTEARELRENVAAREKAGAGKAPKRRTRRKA